MLKGVKGLLSSRKGVLCLLVLISMNVLAYVGKIDGMSFCACCTLISSIYCFVQHRVDLASLPPFQGRND